MNHFPTTSAPSANDAVQSPQPHCGSGASAPCTCAGCAQRPGASEAMQTGSTPAAMCSCAACNCA